MNVVKILTSILSRDRCTHDIHIHVTMYELICVGVINLIYGCVCVCVACVCVYVCVCVRVYVWERTRVFCKSIYVNPTNKLTQYHISEFIREKEPNAPRTQQTTVFLGRDLNIPRKDSVPIESKSRKCSGREDKVLYLCWCSGIYLECTYPTLLSVINILFDCFF